MLQSWTGTSPYLDSVANCYIAVHLSPVCPFLPANQFPPEKSTWLCPFYISLSENISPVKDHSLTQLSPVSVPEYRYPSLPEFDSAISPPSPTSQSLTYSHFRVIAASEIYANVSLSCFWSTVLCYHVSQSLPPPYYPVAPEQTSSIILNTNHSVTVSCRVPMYVPSVCLVYVNNCI